MDFASDAEDSFSFWKKNDYSRILKKKIRPFRLSGVSAKGETLCNIQSWQQAFLEIGNHFMPQ
jgi:hypothetical protein